VRPLHQGARSLGLVNIPVAVYPATPRSASPIAARVCSAENVEVPWAEIVEGYDKGEFVVLTEEDFRSAGAGTTQTIDIRDFVPAGGRKSTAGRRAPDRVAGRRRAS
jgi:DNA end-binding protein Ku